MANFRGLKVWQKAHELTLLVYRETEQFPPHELYGLTSQMRRCSTSIPANIAEGSGRMGDPELGRFLRIALGSANELEYLLLLALDLGLLSERSHNQLNTQTIEIQRMLASFLQELAPKPKGQKLEAKNQGHEPELKARN
jgi:four helix bundle protein